MAVVVDSGLTSRAIMGRFFRRLEEFADAAWWTKLAMRFSSNQESETYKWLGMVPQVREWVGGRKVQPLRANGITIVNKVWESTIRIDADEQRRDKTGQIMVRINELARRVATHPNSLLTTLIENGDATVGYDGQFFFDTDHSEGDSGTQSNDITFDVATPSAPTDAEMYEAIVKGIAQMIGFKDDTGEPMNESARDFMVMVPTSFLSSTLIALSSNNIDSTGNPLAGSDPFKVDWVANPRLTWTDKFAVFRTDGESRPFIFQEELPLDEQIGVPHLALVHELRVNQKYFLPIRHG